MSAWLVEAIAAAGRRHDKRCAKGSGCPSRDLHVQNDYVRAAVLEHASKLADELAQTNAWLRGTR